MSARSQHPAARFSGRAALVALALATTASLASADEPIVEGEIPIMDAGPRPNTAAVDVGADGAPAIFWTQDAGDGVNTIICLQRIEPSSEQRTTPLLANASGGLTGAPTGRVLPDGSLFTFWGLEEGTFVKAPDGRVLLAASQGSSVVGRRFDPNGQPLGDEIIVSTGGEGESNRPASAVDVDGDTVVVWEDSGDLFARVYDAAGNELTARRQVSDRVSGGARAAAVAKAPSGEVVVAWRQITGAQRGIFVRVLNGALQPFGPSVQVANLVNATAAALAIDRNGGFAVAWEENGVDGRDVFVRRYGRRAQPRGQAIPINPTTEGDQTRPKLDFDAAGRLVVTWESSTTPAAGALPNAATVAQGGSVVGRVFDPDLGATSEEVVIAESENGTEPASPAVTVDDQGRATVVFQKESTADQTSQGLFRKRVRLPSGSECSPGDNTLCLNGGRFGVEVDFDPPSGPIAAAGAVPLTGDTGYFWFFGRENVEVVVKVLEACAINGKRWVFAAGLTDVPLDLEVTDSATGARFTVDHGGGAFPPVLDTSAFDCGAGATASPRELSAAVDAAWAELASELAALQAVREPGTRSSAQAAAECTPSDTRLCLNESRFEVEVSFRRPGSARADAESVKLTADTGFFWFFDEENVEVVVKVLNGCAFNDRYWVFAGGLTDVEVDLEVSDTVTGESVGYSNPQGQPFAQIRDTGALDACP